MPGSVMTDFAFLTGATGGVSNCDSVTDWSGAPTLDTEIYIEGTGALSAKVSKTTYTSLFSVSGSVNLTGKQIIVWMMCGTAPGLATKASGGVRIRIEDGAGNWREWYVAGKDTWSGGWEPFCVQADYVPGAGEGAQSSTPPNIAAITKVGVVFYMVGTSAKINCWWDALRVGTYIGLKGGTSASPARIEDILTDTANGENVKKWGCVVKYAGVYIVQTKLYIGSTTSGDSTYFKDTSQVLIFKDIYVQPDFYVLKFQGNATAETRIYFGDKVGGRGVSGLTVRSVSSSRRFDLDATDANVNYFGIYGSNFFLARRISLPAYSANKEILNCNFEQCWEVYGNTTTIKYSNFISPSGETPARAYRMVAGHPDGNGKQITDCVFINCDRAVEIPGSGTYTFDALTFYGNTYDIDNTSGGLVTVNCIRGSNPTTYTGNTVIQTAISLTVRKVKTGYEPNEYVRVSIHRKDTMQEIMNRDANVPDDLNPGYYKATQTYVGATGFPIIIRAREKGWLPYEIELTMPATDLDITAVWLPDPNYNV